uniref:Putative paraquat-inducible protein A n=1 Tax=Magnetococcus massalia (strain MO-1) TaxID=451514 RepID=A0A1S7LNF1_MAGMO|nr:Putative paraquat-inducible protein A [Candidatus Magnetococcus massalia]
MGVGEPLVCPWCDTLHRMPDPLPRGALSCTACRSTLINYQPHAETRALVWSLTALLLFLPATLLPFMALEVGGQWQAGSLLDGVFALQAYDRPMVALLVLFTGILAPLLHISGIAMIALMMMRRTAPPPRWGAPLFRHIKTLQHWSMLEVYMLGLMVAATKLGDLAHVALREGLLAFVLLVIVSNRAAVALDPVLVWRRWQMENR